MSLDIKLLKDDNLMLEEKNISYNKNEDIIHFKLESFDHYIDLTKKRRTKKIFKRESEEFSFEINIEQETCIYKLKEIDGMFNIIVDDTFWLMQEKSLEIHYVIETEDEKNKILINFNNLG